MEILRLIVTGATGTGKSTLIRSVSEIEVVDTMQISTPKPSCLNPKNTIALDFGRLNFNPGMAIHLYGTPGQARFDFMWNLLIGRSHACLLLIGANRPGDFRDASRILAFMKARVQIPIIIGLTHTDCPGAWSKEDATIALGYGNQRRRPTIMQVNPNKKASVIQVLITLVEQLHLENSENYSIDSSFAA